MMLLDAYNNAIVRHDITDDPAQRDVLPSMQRICDELAAQHRRWFCFRRAFVTGLYLYGPVGVGKTFLGDLFYQCAPEPRKARFHFHHFMQQVDAQLRRLQGQANPLHKIAARLAKTTRLLFFDEFMVDDVADAMILSELFQALITHRITLVITSNIRPDELYRNGILRDRFLPVIALIKAHCDVIGMPAHPDHRLGRQPFAKAYVYPLNKAATEALEQYFMTVSETTMEPGALCVQKRSIPYVKCGTRVVWFHFDVICNLPRRSLDYLESADRFDTVLVSDVPQLMPSDTVRVILWIHFIDVMYDRGIRLIISAAVPMDKLYVEGALETKFQRTLSRLEEMQSEDYHNRHQHRLLTNFIE